GSASSPPPNTANSVPASAPARRPSDAPAASDKASMAEDTAADMAPAAHTPAAADTPADTAAVDREEVDSRGLRICLYHGRIGGTDTPVRHSCGAGFSLHFHSTAGAIIAATIAAAATA